MIDLPVVERARRILADAKGGATWRLSTRVAPKVWHGRFYEDFDVGDVFRSRFGRTVTEYDNMLVHLPDAQHELDPLRQTSHAERTQFGQILVNSTFTLALITGLTVPDTSENAAANLAWTDIALPNPVFVGDTLWAESEILDKRESKSNPNVGIVIDALPRDQPARARS